MSVISKEKAQQTAKQLCAKHKEKIAKMQVDFKTFVMNEYNKTVPKHILNSFKKNRDFFRTCETININGAGFGHNGYYQIYTPDTKKVINNSGNYYATFKVSGKLNDTIIDMKRSVETAEEKYKSLYKETVTALLNLKTIKRITEQFPEAIPCFPAQVYPVPVVLNIDKLRKEFAPTKKTA